MSLNPETLARTLNLQRPLVWLDLESTGWVDGGVPDARNDRIVQVGVIKIYPDGKVTQFASLVNPLIPITKSTTDKHGITDDQVKDVQPWKGIGRLVAAGMDDSDLAGFNARRYDFPLLVCECQRNGINYTGDDVKIIDPYLIWTKQEPRDQAAAMKRFLGIDNFQGHRADEDVAGACLLMLQQLVEWPDLPRTVPGLADFCSPPNPAFIDPHGKIQWRAGVPTMCFGKYQDWDMRKVPLEYFSDFILNPKKDFSPQMKRLARDATDGVYPSLDALPFPAPADAAADDDALPFEVGY